MDNAPKGLAEAIEENIQDQTMSRLQQLTAHVKLIRPAPGDILAIEIPAGVSSSTIDIGIKYLKEELPAGTYFFFHGPSIDIKLVDTNNRAVIEATKR